MLARLAAAGRRRRPAAREETFWAIRRFLEAPARERPLVLVFDDIHWGEPTFLDLSSTSPTGPAASPILLLCMARPDLLDLRPTWGGGKMNATTVSLEPLTDEQCERLIANLLGAADLPPWSPSAIAEAAEGNPLFVEEMLEMLIDDGRLERANGSWLAGRRARRRGRPAVDLRAARGSPRPPRRRRARGDRAGLGDRQGLLRRGDPRPCSGRTRRPNLRDLVMGARPARAGPTRALDASGRGAVPVPTPADPRRGLRGDAEGAPRRAARALRGLARSGSPGERIDEQEEILGLPPRAGRGAPTPARPARRAGDGHRPPRGVAPSRRRATGV